MFCKKNERQERREKERFVDKSKTSQKKHEGKRKRREIKEKYEPDTKKKFHKDKMKICK